MRKFIWYRLKRKILVDGIKNEIVRDNYIRYLNYCYLNKCYQNVTDNNNYGNISNEETKKIWVCWFQGWDAAPDIVKNNFNRLKKLFSDYEVIMVTENNFKDYVNIPDYIVDKWQKGIISHAHFSDILRAFLLSDIGGIWIDSTVYTTAKKIPDYISNSKFFMFKEISLNRGDEPIVLASSWFIKSNKNNPILLLTKDLLCKYWENTDILLDYFAFHIFLSIACKKYSELWNAIPTYNNVNPHIMQFELFDKYNETRFKYYEQISDFHKLTYKFKEVPKGSVLAHIMENKDEK